MSEIAKIKIDLDSIKNKIRDEKREFIKKGIEDQIEDQYKPVVFRDDNGNFTLEKCSSETKNEIVEALIELIAEILTKKKKTNSPT